MGNTLMSLLVKLGVDTRDFNTEMDQAESKAHSTGKGIMRGIGGALAGLGTAALAAGGAVTAALASTIQPASDLAETMSKVRVIFGDSADGIEDWGAAASTALGMSTNTAMAAVGTYGNLFKSMGITGNAVNDMSIGLVELSADLASFNNMDPTQVLDALRAGLSGETEPLKKLGVNLNAAAVEAKAMAMGLWDGEGAVSAAAKAQATYALVMEQTALAQGDFERTSDGLANQQRIMTANFENIKATIGAGLLPIVNQLVGSFNELLGGIMAIITGAGTMDEKMAKIGDLVSGFVNGIVKGLPSIIQMGAKMVISIVTGIVSMLPALIPAVVELLMTLVNGIITLLPILLEAGLQIIVALAMGLADALPTLIPSIVQMMLTLVTVLVENIPMLIEAAIAIILGLVKGIVDALPMLIEQLPIIIMTIVNVLLENIPMILQAALEIILALVQGLITAIPQLVMAIPPLIVSIVTALIENVPLILDAGVQLVVGLIEGIGTMLKPLWDIGVDAITGFWEGLKSKFADIMNNIKQFVKDVIDALKGVLGIASPSKVFAGIGANMMLGMAKGIEDFSNVPLDMTAEVGMNATMGIPSTGGSEAGEVMGIYQGPSANDIANALAYKLMAMGAVG